MDPRLILAGGTGERDMSETRFAMPQTLPRRSRKLLDPLAFCWCMDAMSAAADAWAKAASDKLPPTKESWYVPRLPSRVALG